MKTNVLCKAFATAGLAAVVFSACNKVETPETTTDSLVAAKVLAGIQTKASGSTWDASDAIGITTTNNKKKDGNEYTNVKFTNDGTGTFHGSSPIYFQNKENVTFTAYYPFIDPEGNVPGTLGSIDANTGAANQSGDAQKQIDFMWARTTTDVTNPTVSFTGSAAFTHKMSMLTLTFVKGDDVLLADLSQYKLGGITLDGRFNTIEGTAAANGTPGDLTIVLPSVTEGTSYTAGSLILFPQTILGGKVQLEVTLNSQTYKAELSLAALAAGKNHTFNITVKKTGISTASAEITDWTDETPIDAEATM